MAQKNITSEQCRKAIRYIAGEMNKAEKTMYRIELVLRPDSRTAYTQTAKDWKSMAQEPNIPEFNSKKAWERLQRRIETSQAERVANPVINSGYRLLRIAALVTIGLFIAGISTYRYYTPPMLTVTNESNESSLVTTLPDGTNIFLASNSSFTYPKRFVGTTRSIALRGEAYFDIAKNAEKPFIITTDNATVRILGTKFNLKSRNNHFELEVVEGKVSINLNKNRSKRIIAVAGDRIVSGNGKLQKRKIGQPATVANRTTRLTFMDQRFEDIIGAINSYYGSSIKITGQTLQNRKISATFENDLHSIITILSESLDLTITRNADGSITLSEKRGR